MQLRYAIVLCLLPAVALADPPAPPTVSLTQEELQSIVNAAVANFVANEAAQKAKVADDKLKAAFSPKVSGQ